MWKKWLAAMLSLALMAGAVGCGQPKAPPEEDVDENKVEQEFSFATELTEQSWYPLSTGRTFYVSSKGSDTNDGLSKETPLKTIGAVNNLTLQAGDSVLFRGGEAFNGTLRIRFSGADDNPITIAAYDDETERPTLVSNQAHTIVFTNISNLVIRDLKTVTVSAERTTESPGPKQVGILGINDRNTSEKHQNIYIHNNLVTSSGPLTNSDGIAFVGEYPTFAQTPEAAVSNIYVTCNEVVDVGRTGIFTSQNVSMKLYRNVNFIGNTVHSVGQIGMYVGSATESKILRNTVYDTGLFDKPFAGEGECGIMAICCDTCDVMYNVAYGNLDASVSFDAMGIDIDWNSTNVNVQYNYLYDNKGGGVGTMANQNSFIRNNRIENNLCETNMTGQIQVSSFTVYDKEGIADDMHGVTDLLVENNLVISDKEGKNMLRTNRFNGSEQWKNTVFQGNHMISNTTTDDYWIYLDADVPWYKFTNNKYYKANLSKFKSLDVTAAAAINTAEGAQTYVYDGTFEAWKKRDVGATFETVATDVPTRVSGVRAVYENGKLKLSWEKSAGNLWHYNVYCVGEGEAPGYTNLLGEAFGETFEYAFAHARTGYIVIQPESNQGNCGKGYKIKVTLGGTKNG